MSTRKGDSIFWLSARLIFWCLNRFKCGFLLTFVEFFIIPRPRMTLPLSWFLHFLQQFSSNCHTCTDEIRSSLETEITVVHCRGSAEYTTYPHTKLFYITRAFSVNSPNILLQIEQKLRRFLSCSFLKPPIISPRLLLNSLLPTLSSTLPIFCSLNITDQVSHPRK